MSCSLAIAAKLATLGAQNLRQGAQVASEKFLSLYQAKVFNADELDAIRRAGLSEQ
jgi:hypothetical protein